MDALTIFILGSMGVALFYVLCRLLFRAYYKSKREFIESAIVKKRLNGGGENGNKA